MLTAACKNAKPKAQPFKLYDEKGLYLLIHPNGSKYWRLKYRVAGTEKLPALGVYPEVTLALARMKRDEARTLHSMGVDPSAARQQEKQTKLIATASSFETIAREWLKHIEHKWSKNHSTYTVLRKNQRHAIFWISSAAHAKAGTNEYSWCNPPSTDFERTTAPSSNRWRKYDGFVLATTVFGGPGRPGPKLLCGRPPL